MEKHYLLLQYHLENTLKSLHILILNVLVAVNVVVEVRLRIVVKPNVRFVP
jgi:hypothetical protein